MSRRDVLSRVLLWFAAFAVIIFTGVSAIADNPQVDKQRGRGRGVGEKRGEGHAFAKAAPERRQSSFEKWRAARDKENAAQKQSESLRKQIPIASGALGRSSVVINDGNQILFTKVFPGSACDPDPTWSAPNITIPLWTANTAYSLGEIRRRAPQHLGVLGQVTTAGVSGPAPPVWPTVAGQTVNDGTVVWTGIGYHPGNFAGCNPMQLVHRSSAGTETVLATEGQTIPGGSTQLGGWAEFYDMNNAGLAAFKGHVVGVQFLGENFGPDEAATALFTAGPGNPLTRRAGQGDVVGTRTLCGIGPMMKINDAGQIAYEGFFLTGAGQCDENTKGVFRFTPPSTNEFMFGIGSTVPGGGTITLWGDQGDGDFFGGINSLGHSAISVQLSDGDQAVYLITAPGVVTEVARSGNAGPGGIFDRIGAQVYINDSDQVLFKAAIGGDGNPATGGEDGVDNLILFTPGSGTQKVVALTDPVPGGGTYQGFGAFADLNNSGNVVFRAGLVGILAGVEDSEQAGIFHWTRATNTFAQVIRVAPGTFGLFNDAIGMNNADAVFFGVHNGSQPAGFNDDEEQEGSIRFWTATGGVQTIVALGQNLDGSAITAVWAQHIPFKRQFNETCSFASEAFVNNNEPDDGQENTHQGRLFALFNTTCGVVGPTPTFTPTGTVTVVPTSTPTITIVVGGPVPVVPTLSLPMLLLLGIALVGIAFFVLRKV
jgi:hypothetical protein